MEKKTIDIEKCVHKKLEILLTHSDSIEENSNTVKELLFFMLLIIIQILQKLKTKIIILPKK